MRARYMPRLTNRELAVVNETYFQQQLRSVYKAQYIMLIAFNEALGIGEKRISKVMDLYPKLVEEFNGLEKDDVGEEMLRRRMKKLCPRTFDKLFPEEETTGR